MEEAKRKAEAEIAHLEVERTSLLLELGETKDEVSSVHSQAGKDKEVMNEGYQKALELIFAYGYGCCVFKHNICKDQQEVLDCRPDSFDPLSPEFFVNPRCSPALAAPEATTAEEDPNEAVRKHEGSAPARDLS